MIDHPIIGNPIFWICAIATIALIVYLVGISPSKKNYEVRKNLAVVALALFATGIAYIMFIAPVQQIWQAMDSAHHPQSSSRIVGAWDCHLLHYRTPYFYRFTPYGTGVVEATTLSGRLDDQPFTWDYTRISNERGTLKITLLKSPQLTDVGASIHWAGNYNSFQVMRSNTTSLTCTRLL